MESVKGFRGEIPKKLANNWNQYRDNVRTNLFYRDRIHFDVVHNHMDVKNILTISF